MDAESRYGRELADALETLRETHSQKLLDLLPKSIRDVMGEDYIWPHDAIQRELDDILAKKHADLYDLTRIGDQQDKATLLSTDTSIFSLIPRCGPLHPYIERASCLPCQTTLQDDFNSSLEPRCNPALV